MGSELHALAVKTKESSMDQRNPKNVIEKCNENNEICLFMKGTPDSKSHKCGFLNGCSRTYLKILKC